jgi:RNA polymerase sigma factor (sigma-70 family)
MSHSGDRRCCRGMDVARRGGVATPVVLSASGVVPGAAAGRAGRKERVSVSVSVRGAVRADLDEIFRRDYPLVVGVAARVLGSLDQAEDVAQDVFLSFGRSSVPVGSARGWLCVAAAHTALNLLRSGRRRTSREETAAAADGVVASDVAEVVVTLEERSRVRAALARLPRKHAVALVLRHSGLSYADVAAALDMSPGSVGTTVRRAESTLRKELNRHAASE